MERFIATMLISILLSIILFVSLNWFFCEKTSVVEGLILYFCIANILLSTEKK